MNLCLIKTAKMDMNFDVLIFVCKSMYNEIAVFCLFILKKIVCIICV